MEPVQRNDHNFTYKGRPQDDIGDLHCRVEGEFTFAHFKPSEDELRRLNEGELVQLHIIGHPIPPVGIEVVPVVASDGVEDPTGLKEVE